MPEVITEVQGAAAPPVQDLGAMLQSLQGEIMGLGAGLERLLQTPARPGVAASIVAQAETKKPNPKHNFGHWFTQVFLAQRGSRDAEACLRDQYQSVFSQALSEDSGATGGYLVPQQFRSDLFRLVAERSIVRPRATVVPMTSRTLKMPALDMTTAPTAGNTRFYGGVTAFWTETDTATTETEPAFRQIEMVAHELAGHTIAGNAMMDDSGNTLSTLLPLLFAGAIAWYEDDAFINGDGVGKPIGILNAGSVLKTVTRNTANDFKLVDAAKMLEAFLASSLESRGGTWLITQTALNKLLQMADANNVVFIPNAREPIPMSLFGMPIVLTEKLPALGTQGDVVLADLSMYLVGDRQDTVIDTSPHFKFTSNQTTWRFVHRVDGKPWLNNVITLRDATTTVSPFVALL